MTREEAIENLRRLQNLLFNDPYIDASIIITTCNVAIKALEQTRWIPVSDKYEYHIDHTDCIWYGNDSGCPCTCSQYRDGWNDAMNYIFKDGKGYQPYRRDTDG